MTSDFSKRHMGSKKDVLRGSGTVLNPEVTVFTWLHASCVSTDNDYKRSLTDLIAMSLEDEIRWAETGIGVDIAINKKTTVHRLPLLISCFLFISLRYYR